MIRLLLIPTMFVAALLTVAVGMIRAWPVDNSDLSDFLLGTDDCPALCFLGIYPGRTTVEQALDQLRTHEWVGSAQLNASGRGYGDIRWQWSGQQSAFIDTTRPARITFYWDDEDPDGPRLNDSIIETLTIYTDIRMYRLQAWFGLPDNGTSAFRNDENLGYAATYNVDYGMVDISTVMTCPAQLLSYWEARARITLSIGRSSSPFVPPNDATRMC